MPNAPVHQNGTRILWIRILSGAILLIFGGALAFFFNHTQLEAHPGMEKRADRNETDLRSIQTDVRANRESLIRIETKLDTTPPGGG